MINCQCVCSPQISSFQNVPQSLRFNRDAWTDGSLGWKILDQPFPKCPYMCTHTHTSTESFYCGCFYLFNYYFIFIIPQIFIECLLYPSTLLDSSRHSNEKPQKFLPLWSLYPSRNVPLSFLLEMGSERGDFLGIPVGKTPHSQWRGLGFSPWSGN